MQVFTEEDIDNCWPAHKFYLLEILNGEYEVAAARTDLAGLIGSKYDRRYKPLDKEKVEI